MKLTFLGAAGTVSGSKTLIEVAGKKLLVDCGLFQGPKSLRILNWEEFPGAASIDAVILTHAHIDHSGYLPKLCKSGFCGPVYCSAATADLCRFMLMDAAYLQEEDSIFANKTKHSRHYPALPLFTAADAEAAIKHLTPIADEEWFQLSDDLSILLKRSGHLLGSRFVQLNLRGERNFLCTFSGDLGHDSSNIIKGPVTLTETDALVLESTYGNRTDQRTDPFPAIEALVRRVCDRRGVLVIPAFAVGRTQEVLYILGELKRQRRIPNIKVYIDSPMALQATATYKSHVSELKAVLAGNHVMDALHFSEFEPVRSVDESMLLCMQDGPFVVISASGMLSGGRVLHHLKHRLPDARNAILFVGYQAEETKGRLLQDGIESLRIHHQETAVEAEICTIDSLSAHANTAETIAWLKSFARPVRHLFLNHGEPEATEGLRQQIQKELGWEPTVPRLGESFTL